MKFNWSHGDRRLRPVVAGAILGFTLSACTSKPSAADIDLSKVVSASGVAAKEAEQMRKCMLDAGYPKFEPVVQGVHQSSGVPFALADIVDLVLADAATTPPKDLNKTWLADLSAAEQNAYGEAFQKCDDVRVTARQNTDSLNGRANQVLVSALTAFHKGADYQTDLRSYVHCMRGKGWTVSDYGDATAPVFQAMQSAIVAKAGHPAGQGDLGYAGLTLSADGVSAAREIQKHVDADDASCGQTTLDPLYASFDQQYGPLVGAIYGVTPTSANRIRL
jgi:hypothetical protein